MESGKALGKKPRPFSHVQSPWLILLIVLLTSMAAPLNQFKVPPVMPVLMEAFGQSAGGAGLLMSLFAVTGLFLAIPVGFILQSLGYRLSALIATLSLIAGSGIGALSRSMEIMLASRFIEGAGMSFMSVVAPAIIAMRFGAEKRGKAMGIWAVWVPLGSMIMFIVAPSLAARWGWRGLWWFGFSYALIMGLFFYLFIKPDPGSISHRTEPPPSRGLRELGGVLRNRDLWLISLVFCCFNFVYVAFITWAPTFLNQIRHASLTRSSLLVSVTSLLTIMACPTAGWISDRIGSRKVICVIPLILMGFLFPLISSAGEDIFLVLAAAIGFIGGFVPPGVFSAGVEAVGEERLGGMAMAVIQIGQNSGMLLGPLIFGWAMQSWGWQAAFWILAPVSMLGAVSGWIARMK
ncbi:MAG: MFS transporter [Deltaproteobacteria bacterium]|nr:MAG: MFS transporter [Deltaproteobacteria bacterium]